MSEWLKVVVAAAGLIGIFYLLHYLSNSTRVCTPFRTVDGYLNAFCIRHDNETAQFMLANERGAFIDNRVEWNVIREHNEKRQTQISR
jgi:hypothetical protein